MIYFARLSNGAIKIGCTANLARRRTGLRSELGCDIEVLATIEGGKATEREIHERFSHIRLGTSEQFQPGDDLMDFIGHPHIGGYQEVEQLPIRHMGIRPTQIRLTRDDLEILGLIRTEEGLRTMADAIRFAAKYAMENSK